MIVNEEINKFNIVPYIWQKYKKLWPAYFISISITYICSYILPLGLRKVNFITYILNISMLNGFISSIKYVDGTHWYISTLLIIYSSILGICMLFKINNFSSRILVPFSPNYIGIVIFFISLKKFIRDKKYIVEKRKNLFIILISLIYIFIIREIFYGIIFLISIVIFILCILKK